MATSIAEFNEILLDLKLSESWEQKNGSWWGTMAKAEVRPAASRMLAESARLITITAIELASHEVRMDYHWDIGGQIITLAVIADGKLIDSIADIPPPPTGQQPGDRRRLCRGVSGRVDTMPLMLRMGDELGINLHKGGTE